MAGAKESDLGLLLDIEAQQSLSARSSQQVSRPAQAAAPDTGAGAGFVAGAGTETGLSTRTGAGAEVGADFDAVDAESMAGLEQRQGEAAPGDGAGAGLAVGDSLVDPDAEFDPYAPLAARMRPRSLDDYFGQSHLLAPGKPLRQALERGHCYSMILWGPPGVGKTTLAFIIAHSVNAVMEQISAVVAGIKDIRAAVERAQARKKRGIRTILFVDEVHRFNKAQQDAFLPHIENGTVIFIGATTENPSFQVNSALMSRARVYVLHKLSNEEMAALLDHTLNSERGLAREHLILSDKVRSALIAISDGDARQLLTTLEMLADDAATTPDGHKVITYAMLGAVAGRRLINYDKGGDAYYDLISAFHKSVRGSAPDAALYWYSRILEAGGDPLYVARRLLAIATEDIGLADPQAMQVGLNAWDIFTRVGEAEGERAIAEAAVYMALAPKSNHLYQAFNQAREDASRLPSFEVPLYIRNAPTKLMSELGYHRGYRYAHDYPNGYAAGECFMPEELHGRSYYQPTDRGYEAFLRDKLAYLRQCDELAPPDITRYPPEHAREMMARLKRYVPELFADDAHRNPSHT